MRTILRAIAGFILPAMLFCSCADDYTLDIYGTISGKVTDYSTGEPLQAALVTLVQSSSTVQTESDGTFSFEGLEEGQYTVSVQKDGYKPDRKNDVTVVSGETTTIVVSLEVIPQ